MKISIICAMDQKKGIGKNNRIPWRIKEDLVKLKNLTKDHVVILGRKSYESMVGYYNRTGNPMPGKIYIVVTHDKNYKPVRENAIVAHAVGDAVEKASYYCHSEFSSESTKMLKLVQHDKDCGVFIIGGQQIFEQTIGLADKLYLTIINGDYRCDTFFPDYSGFKKVIHEESRVSEGYRYKFLELEQ